MSLFNKIGALFAAKPEDRRVSHALSIVETTLGPHLLALPGSEERLLPVVTAALDYYDKVIAAIPGPLDVAPARHGDDPRVQALFPSADDIGLSLGRSIAVRNSLNWFVEQGFENVHALMGMRVVPPEPGSGGGQPQDHTFRSLGVHDQDVRAGLREAAFTALIKGLAADLKEQTRALRLLQASGKSGSENKGDNREAIDLQLAETGDRATLERLEGALIAWIAKPERQLALEATEQSVFVPAFVPGDSPRHLPELTTADRRKWLVCLVSFPLLEAVNAVAQETRAHRYILI